MSHISWNCPRLYRRKNFPSSDEVWMCISCLCIIINTNYITSVSAVILHNNLNFASTVTVDYTHCNPNIFGRYFILLRTCDILKLHEHVIGRKKLWWILKLPKNQILVIGNNGCTSDKIEISFHITENQRK